MSNVGTLPQAKHLIEVFEPLESGRLQALIASGLLVDLRRCAAELDPTKVDRDQYRRVLGLGPSVFSVKMSGPETTDDIVSFLRVNGFYHVNYEITQANFPLAAQDGENVEIEIIDPDCLFSETDGLRFLAEAKLERPTYQQALRFAFEHGRATNSTKKPFVIFLHEAWQGPGRGRRVLRLGRGPSRCGLGLSYPGRGFDVDCVLAGVRPRKQPSAA